MKTIREYIDLIENAQTPGQQYKIYFVIPDDEDYDDRNEPTETTIVTANSASEAGKKFKFEVPEAYIEQIVPLNHNKDIEEDQATAKMGLMSAMGSNDNAPDRQRMAAQAIERMADNK